MRSLTIFLYLFSGMMMLLSCGEKTGTPPSSGGTSEILVVTDPFVYEKAFRDSILSILSAPVPGIYPEESRFDLVFVPRSAFSDIMHRHHSILLASVNDTSGEFSATTSTNLWAAPQTVVMLQAEHPDSLMAGLSRFDRRILKVFTEAEHARQLDRMRKDASAEHAHAITEKTGLEMTLPASYTLVSKDAGRLWFRRFSNELESSLCFFTGLQTSAEGVSAARVSALIDSLGMLYLKGSADSSRFGVSYKFPVNFRVQKTWLRTVYVCRGWWQMSHDMMGGPFLAYLYRRNDADGWTLILAYVYHPNKPKRDNLLELEALIEDALYRNKPA